MKNAEKMTKDAFCVIGKMGSTNDGPDFIQRLWKEANGNFSEVAHLACRDEQGNVLGVWGIMTDFGFRFQPWEDNFSKGLYLAGIEAELEAAAPKGWKKWIVPGFEYWKVKVEGADTFRQTLAWLEERKEPLAGAVQDFTNPATGENYMLFPVGRNDSKEALIGAIKARTNPVGVCSMHCQFCFLGQWCGGCRSGCDACSYATLFEDNVCPNVRCAGEKGFHSCAQCPELMDCNVGFYQQPNAATHKGTALFVRRHGEHLFTQALSAAIREGVSYTGDLDQLEDSERVCALLEQYLK